ncbi:MAG: poly(R)-hydroxyalkanoic acid synthase subunit PhaE [Thermodesulfobacteriota bacterium]
MDQDNRQGMDPATVFSAWMKSASGFWEEMFKMQAGGQSDEGGFSGNLRFRRYRKTMESSAKVFQSLFSSLTKPDNIEEMMKGVDYIPDFLMTMARQSWDGYAELQRQFMDRAAKMGQQPKAYKFDDIDQETFQALRDIYEREFQKFLKVPALGLTRFHQERVNDMMDKYNLFQTALGEFLYMFYVPIEKTSAAMQEKVEEMAEKGEIFDNFKDYYNLWIRTLEGHYMTLLQSPEYTEVMDKTIAQLAEYRSAKDKVMYYLLSKLPIPTNRDMDEVYKDLYLLKKKVNELCKRMDAEVSA